MSACEADDWAAGGGGVGSGGAGVTGGYGLFFLGAGYQSPLQEQYGQAAEPALQPLSLL